MAPKTSPWARPISRQPRGAVVKIRARVSSSKPARTPALPRLLVDFPLAYRRAIVRGRRTPADLDRRTNADRAGIADHGLPLTAGGEDASRRHGHHAR